MARSRSHRSRSLRDHRANKRETPVDAMGKNFPRPKVKIKKIYFIKPLKKFQIRFKKKI
jgi:hypothetical protein